MKPTSLDAQEIMGLVRSISDLLNSIDDLRKEIAAQDRLIEYLKSA